MPNALITRFAALEQKLDTVLFRKPEENSATPRTTDPATIAGGVATIGGAAYGKSVLQRGLAPLVADRLSGQRATTAGFAGLPAWRQKLAATASVLKDKPLAALKGVGGTLASDATVASQTLKKGATDAGKAIQTSAAGTGYIRARRSGMGVAGSLRRGLGGVAAALTRGRVKFSAKQRVIELAAKCA